MSFVEHRQFYLLLKRNFFISHFLRQSFLIYFFKKTTSQLPMYLHCRANNSRGLRISFIFFHNHL